MAKVSATYSIKSVNKSGIIIPMQDDMFELTLAKGVAYDIGIDQSSTCTGIAISSIDDNINVIIDVRNDSFNKETFYRELRSLLKRLVHGMQIRLVVCEDPPPVKNKYYSSAVLLELRGRVSAWMTEIEELSQADFRSIFPQSWKPFIVDKSKGPNRSNIKKCIAEDVCAIIPDFEKYMVYAPKDYDSYDAYGILAGYKKYAFNEKGQPLICGKIEKKHKSFVGYRYVPISEVKPDTVHNFMGTAVKLLKPVFLNYNERYNRFNNIRMATSNWDCSYTILPDSCLDVLKWEYDLEVKDDYILLAYLFNSSHYPQMTRTSLTRMFPMHEEVTTC